MTKKELVEIYRNIYGKENVHYNYIGNYELFPDILYSLDYDASKAGVISLSSNLAKAYAPIRVNTIAPGWIDTDMNINLDNEDRDRECQNIILNRFGKMEEVSNVCMFLASSKASYVNNTVIRVDGGKI